ncbi:MAG TPA: insulinase family protein [Bryobacteraceae bacterium]|nr:insulinase family protein [Bryobacteraceae bacterium]
MKKILSLFALAAVAAFAQATPPRTTHNVPATPSRTGAARVASLPSYKELKYPPLKPIQIPPVETATLPNGMKLYLLEDHELPVVNGTALIRTGNLFDPADKVGLATMTGMVMRTGGTKAKTGDQLDQELEDVAASVESNIGESNGSVSFSALKENTDEVLGVFHDVLTSPEFRQGKIDLAKTQLSSSIARRNDDAHGISRREFTNIVYGKDTPYGWDIQYATLDRITRADLVNFYQRYFFPANVMLAVWGDFDSAAMKSKIEQLFADWTVKQPPVPPFPKVQTTAAPGTYLAVKQDVTQTFFAMGHLGGELRDKDYPALEVMSDILGGGFESRLFKRIRSRMGDAYDIGANWGANYDHPGLFEIAGSTKSPSTVSTIQAVEEEVNRIRTTEVSDEELHTAKETALNSLVFAFDTKAKTLRRMLTYEYFGYPKDFIQQYQKALSQVTRADVLRVAKEYIDPSRFTIVAVGNPEQFGQKLETLGSPVKPIDLTIPEPKATTAKADPASMAKGKRLLARVQQAVGGADKLAAVKDYTESADFQLDAGAGGMHVKETDRWIAPTRFRQETELPTGKLIAYSDGKTGWIATPQGSGALAGPQLKQVQGDLFRLYYRLLLSDRIPGRTVNLVDDNTIEISDPSGDHARLVVDPKTNLPQRIEYGAVHVAGPPIQVVDAYSDFRPVDGVQVPFKLVITQGGHKFADITVTDYKVNSGLQVQDLEKKP